VRRLVVGVSGGADSTALLLLFTELRNRAGNDGFPELLVGHVHHGLRGQSADGDEEFVKELARSQGLECLVYRGSARRRGLSVEVAARALRHEAFRSWAQELRIDAIALAHHLDDQAETVLLRVARGTGWRGLAGIPRSRPLQGAGSPVQIIRPLLDWRREALEAFLADRRQSFRSDDTNHDLEIPRNRIRHSVLPLLEDGVQPGSRRALVRLGSIATRLAKDLSILGERALDEARVTTGGEGVFLSLAALRSWPPSVIHEALRMGLEQALHAQRDRLAVPQVVELPSRAFDQILAWIQVDGPEQARLEMGKGSLGHQRCRVELRYGLLRLCRMEVRESVPPRRTFSAEARAPTPWLDWEFLQEEVEEPVERETALLRRAPRPADTNDLVERVDAERVFAAGDLAVRCRQAGDRIWPLGSPGSKKLKEFLRERRVWPLERERVPIVVAGDRIVWVVGHRIDHRFRIRPETATVLELKARRRK